LKPVYLVNLRYVLNMQLSKMRDKLDMAITYGSRRAAMKLAREALKKARRQRLGGEICYFQGQVELIRENFVSAIEYFDAAIRYDSRDGGSYNDRALCLAELGLIDEALKCFDLGIRVERDYATIYHNKGWLLNNIGRYKEALACFKKALRLEPERAVTYDNLADVLFNQGNFHAALKAYRKVLALLPARRCPGIRSEIKKRIKQIEEKI